ncbi:MAG: hypothetical protein NTX05_03285 [Fusobacteria bacterium]|nr:hypothetical protein [Fusobacteriota bacterium]
MISRKSTAAPIIAMAGYLSIQIFLIINMVLYAVHGLGQSWAFANGVYGVIWSVNTIIAVVIIKFADKWGYKESCVIAMVCQILAFFFLSIGSVPAFLVGSSLFGTGASLFVSQNYVVLSNTMKKEYSGRNNVFLISYVAMNGAAFFAGIISGYANIIGYTNIFRISMVLSIIMFIFLITFYQKTKSEKGNICYDLDCRTRKVKAMSYLFLSGVAFIAFAILLICCFFYNVVNLLVILSIVATFIYLIVLIFIHKGRERKKIFVFTWISLISIIFWTGYNLYSATAFTTVLDTATNLHNFAVQDVLSVEPLVIMTLGTLVVITLFRLEKKHIHVNAAMRSIIGLLFLSLGFFLPVIGFHTNHFSNLNVVWMIIAIAFCGFGEIFIGSVCNAIAGDCATKKLEGIFIAIGFIVLGGSGSISAVFSNWMENTSATNTLIMTHHYSYTLGVFALIALIGALISIITYKISTKWGEFIPFSQKK